MNNALLKTVFYFPFLLIFGGIESKNQEDSYQASEEAKLYCSKEFSVESQPEEFYRCRDQKRNELLLEYNSGTQVRKNKNIISFFLWIAIVFVLYQVIRR